MTDKGVAVATGTDTAAQETAIQQFKGKFEKKEITMTTATQTQQPSPARIFDTLNTYHQTAAAESE